MLYPQARKVIAHRGASAELPEQTRAAFLKAIEDSADGIECDIQLTKDGVIVCIHDETVDRTSNGTGAVREHTLSELRELDWVSWKGVNVPSRFGKPSEQLLTLRELLELAKNSHRRIDIAIETKHLDAENFELEHQLVKDLRAFGWDRQVSGEPSSPVFVISFNHHSLATLRELGLGLDMYQLVFDPEVLDDLDKTDPRRSAEFAELAERGIEAVDRGEVAGVGTSIGFLRKYPTLVREWKNSGRRLYVWGVEGFSDIVTAVSEGADIIATDYPVQVSTHFSK